MQLTQAQTVSVWTALIGVGFVLCWSSGFVGGVLATQATLPALSLFAWRFLAAALVMAALVFFLVRKPLPRLHLWREMVVGFFTMGGFLLGVMLALELGVSAGLTALIAALQPLVAAAVAGRWLNEHLSRRGWWGMAIATVGVAFCVLGDLQVSNGTVPLWAYALPVFSVLSVTTGSVLSARWSTALPIPAALMMQLLAATVVFMLAASWLEPGGLAAPEFTRADFLALGWLIVLSSFGGYGFFVASLRRMGVTRTSTLIYLTPPVTLVWAGLMFGDWPGLVELGGMALAGVGVVLAMGGLPPSVRRWLRLRRVARPGSAAWREARWQR